MERASEWRGKVKREVRKKEVRGRIQGTGQHGSRRDRSSGRGETSGTEFKRYQDSTPSKQGGRRVDQGGVVVLQVVAGTGSRRCFQKYLFIVKRRQFFDRVVEIHLRNIKLIPLTSNNFRIHNNSQ